ncbi:MAG TPA: hypothetical protein VLL97_09530 [Acidobacteriota bacterium]|nr:hypothetical protein [Acidobacteriota bacterium]
MKKRSLQIRLLAMGLSMAIVVTTAPFSFAQTMNASPLGSIVTTGSVAIGNVSAPTGTTIFTGDRIDSTQTSAIRFNGGSRIAITNASATFDREGEALVINAEKGLLNFYFTEGQSVQIAAAQYVFTGNGGQAVSGSLGVNPEGQLVMNVEEGVLMALNTATGARTQVAAGKTVDNTGTVVDAGLSGAEKAALVAGIAGAGVIIGVGIYNAGKSPSNR